jgi:hypothetical protein
VEVTQTPVGVRNKNRGSRVVSYRYQCGMLIFAACVEMLAADIVLDPTLWRASKRRQVVALVSVALGATGMVLLE